MERLRHYLNVYRVFFTMSFSEASSFRLHFILVILVDIFFYLTSYGAVAFIYDHVTMIGPWDETHFYFFLSFMLLIDNLHMALLSQNYWNFAFDLKAGNLDFYLVKPIAAPFIIFFQRVRAATLLIMPVPLGLLVYFGMQIGLSPLSWVLLLPFTMLAFVLLISLETLIMLAMFWTLEGIGLNFLRMQLQSLSRWPDFIFLYFYQKVFTVVVPILLVGSVPVKILFDHAPGSQLLYMIAAILCIWVLQYLVWQAGLRRYESASS